MARRFIDKAYAIKNSKLVFLALEWAKAFDSIMPGPMLAALERFGLPADFLAMINAIYVSRLFFVSDSGQDSTTKSQSAGITQGCPLSPFLFVIMMSVIITDARAALRDSVNNISSEVTEVLYADDTLIVDEHVARADLYRYHCNSR
jgi:hypothetical protein